MTRLVPAPPERAFEHAQEDILRRLRALERRSKPVGLPPISTDGSVDGIRIGPVLITARYDDDGVTVILEARNTLTATEPTTIATLE